MPTHPDQKTGRRAMIVLLALCLVTLFVIALMGVGVAVPDALLFAGDFLVNSRSVAMFAVGASMCVALIAWSSYYLFRIAEIMIALFVLMGFMMLVSVLFLMGDVLGVAGLTVLVPSMVWLSKLYREHGPDAAPTFVMKVHPECPGCKCG